MVSAGPESEMVLKSASIPCLPLVGISSHFILDLFTVDFPWDEIRPG